MTYANALIPDVETTREAIDQGWFTAVALWLGIGVAGVAAATKIRR